MTEEQAIERIASALLGDNGFHEYADNPVDVCREAATTAWNEMKAIAREERTSHDPRDMALAEMFEPRSDQHGRLQSSFRMNPDWRSDADMPS